MNVYGTAMRTLTDKHTAELRLKGIPIITKFIVVRSLY